MTTNPLKLTRGQICYIALRRCALAALAALDTYFDVPHARSHR